jgi:hypothetical protein
MNNLAAPLSLCAILLAYFVPATAGTINVTGDSQVTVGTGDSLTFYISDNSSGSQTLSYPGEIQVLLGGMPLGGPVASIPGTSGVYMSGFVFDGTLESQNGAVSVPLTDPNATRLGLPNGDMLMTPGSRSGASYSGAIDLVSAEVIVGSQQDATLFATNEVMIDFLNTGASFTFGYAGTSIGSDLSASLFNQEGSQSVGAQVTKVELATVPEPGTVGLLLIGLIIMCTRLGQMRAHQFQLENVRMVVRSIE